MQKLGGEAYASARKNFLEALAEHTGDVNSAKQQAEEVLGQARAKSRCLLAQARSNSEALLKQAQAKSDELMQKAKGKLEKKYSGAPTRGLPGEAVR